MNTIEMLPCQALGATSRLAFLALEAATIKLADLTQSDGGTKPLNYSVLQVALGTIDAALAAAAAEEMDYAGDHIFDRIAAFANAAWALEETAIATQAAGPGILVSAAKAAAKGAADIAADLVDPGAEKFGFPGKAELLARRARLGADLAVAEVGLKLLVDQGFEGDDGGDDGHHVAELIAMAASSALARAGDAEGGIDFARIARCVRFWRNPDSYAWPEEAS